MKEESRSIREKRAEEEGGFEGGERGGREGGRSERGCRARNFATSIGWSQRSIGECRRCSGEIEHVGYIFIDVTAAGVDAIWCKVNAMSKRTQVHRIAGTKLRED